MDFAMMLLEKGNVAVSPGSGFGPAGEGYLRMSLVENEERLRQAVRQIRSDGFRHDALGKGQCRGEPRQRIRPGRRGLLTDVACGKRRATSTGRTADPI